MNTNWKGFEISSNIFILFYFINKITYVYSININNASRRY